MRFFKNPNGVAINFDCPYCPRKFNTALVYETGAAICGTCFSAVTAPKSYQEAIDASPQEFSESQMLLQEHKTIPNNVVQLVCKDSDSYEEMGHTTINFSQSITHFEKHFEHAIKLENNIIIENVAIFKQAPFRQFKIYAIVNEVNVIITINGACTVLEAIKRLTATQLRL